MERPTQRGGKEKGKVEFIAHFDQMLTSYSCYKIVEELIKYLLYQRNQIPIQYDALQRMVGAKTKFPGETKTSPTSANNDLRVII